MTKPDEIPEIATIFWDNVEWHVNNKGESWYKIFGYTGSIYKTKTTVPTLGTVQKIADALNIDDYPILFERVDDLNE